MSKLFPAADCNAESIAFVTECVPSFAGTAAPTAPVGFYLIKDTFVPYSFLDELGGELTYARLNCFEVTKLSDLFEKAYIASLTASELNVLGECVLLLIEQGIVPFSLINTKKVA